MRRAAARSLPAGLLIALCCAGCEPKCREVEPLSELREQMHERIADRLDAVDATDAQLAAVETAFDATLPALQRYRAESLPRERAVIDELRSDAPDRERLARLIEQNAQAFQRYARALMDAFLAAHAAMRPEQRRALAARAREPSERFEGSFMLDRAVDYFVMRIDADAEQRRLVERIKAQLIARAAGLGKQADALRAEAATELEKDRPDRERLHAVAERSGGLARELFRDLAGYYLLLSSKLSQKQRALLRAELVRFEPCGGGRERAVAPPGT